MTFLRDLFVAVFQVVLGFAYFFLGMFTAGLVLTYVLSLTRATYLGMPFGPQLAYLMGLFCLTITVFAGLILGLRAIYDPYRD